MQYFCGLHEFTDKPIFDPSLFVTIRKRLSEEELNKLTLKLLNKQKRLLEEKRKREEEEAKKNDEEPPTPAPEDPNAASFTDSKGREHKRVLKIDATCADAEMRYPVDVDIINPNRSLEKTSCHFLMTDLGLLMFYLREPCLQKKA